MNQAFYTGIVGLQTHQYGIDTISDNLANINTIGFRGAQAEFSSLFEDAVNETSFASTDDTIGVGSQIQITSMMEQNGTLIDGDKNTDLAIDGDGWFAVSGHGDVLYTRAGNFTFDSQRDLVTPDGFHVLGTMGNNITNDTITQTLSSVALGDPAAQVPLNFPESLTYPVEPTTQAEFFGNLGIVDVPRLLSADVISANNEHNRLELRFTQSSPQPASGTAWDIAASITSADGSVVYDTQSGSAIFDTVGGLTSYTLPTLDNDGSAVTADLGSGFTGITAFSDEEAGSNFASSTNGVVAGELFGFGINENADIIATFSNGRETAIGKVAVFHFQNDQGLERISGSRFRESVNSGEPIFFQDINGNNILGTDIRSYKLENSNVRIEMGLTELIIMQRAYGANAKSITTGDELIQKALQMDA